MTARVSERQALGEFGGGRAGLEVDLSQGRPVFIFLGRYRGLVEEARQRYPGGSVQPGGCDREQPSFVSYIVSDARR